MATLRKQLFRGAVGSFALKVSHTLLTLGLTVLLARLLGPEGYGIYSYALALVTVLAIPAHVGLPTLLIREIAGHQVRQQWGLLLGVLRFANITALVMSVGLATLAGLLGWFLAERFGTQQLLTFAWALSLVPLMTLGLLRGAALRGLRKVVQGQLPEQVLQPGLLMVLVGLTVALAGAETLSPALTMALHALAFLVTFLLGAMPAETGPARPQYAVRAWLRSLLPLSFLAGMQVINNRAGIVMLGLLGNAEEVGIYRVASQGAMLVVFGLTAMNMVVSPYVARFYAQNDTAKLQRMITISARVMLLAALPVAAVFVVFGDDILRLVFGADYVPGHAALAILCVGQLINAATGSVVAILNMMGHERDTARSVALAAVLNVMLNALLIPFYGIEGAAVATAVSLAAWNLLMVYWVRRRTGLDSTILGLGRRQTT